MITSDNKGAIGQRIAIVGTTGSGKTTLANQLAERIGYPRVELDALYWGPNWTEAPLDVFREHVAQALSGCFDCQSRVRPSGCGALAVCTGCRRLACKPH